MYESVQKLAGQLRLNGIYHSAIKRCEESLSASLHPAEFLRLILEDEQLSRKNLLAKRLATRAKFRSQCDIENWDMNTPRGISKAKLKDLSCGSFQKRKENLIIRGQTGVGKTHLAIALGRVLCSQGVSVEFYSINLFFESIQAEKAAGRYLAKLAKLTKTDVIIFDDFGLRNYSHDEAMVLLEVLEERYGKGTVIITSQVEPDGWKRLFEDSVASDSIVDRLSNPSDSVLLVGDTYRKKIKRN